MRVICLVVRNGNWWGREVGEGRRGTGLSRMLMAQQVFGDVKMVLSQEGPLWPSGQGEELH